MPPLRLAVDARVAVEDTRGIGRYARAVLRRLATRDDVALMLVTGEFFAARRRAAYERALESANFTLHFRVPRAAQVVWHPANGTFFSSRAPSVATIHDAVPFRYPDADPKRRAHAQQPFLRSARDAARVIAVSEFGRDELIELLGVERERITVVHHGVDPSFAPGPAAPLPRALEARPFLLFVGDPIGEPRKNFSLLYSAFERAWPNGDGPVLAVAGPRAPQLDRVVHLGTLADDLEGGNGATLRACYRGAKALTLASYHETFGMPMLEAMACGTPVVASRASSLPEVGGDAALYVSPDDAQAWADVLRRVVADDALAARLRAAGIARAAEFDWDRSALAHLAIFRAAAA